MEMNIDDIASNTEAITQIVKSRDEDRAVAVCIARGYENLKREDREGKTRSGWWLDDSYLGRTAIDALRHAALGSY